MVIEQKKEMFFGQNRHASLNMFDNNTAAKETVLTRISKSPIKATRGAGAIFPQVERKNQSLRCQPGGERWACAGRAREQRGGTCPNCKDFRRMK